LTSPPPSFSEFEKSIGAEMNAPPQVPGVGGAVQAGFLFGGENYSGQFYSYLWSDALGAEVFETFLAGAGPYDRSVAEKLRKYILSAGNSLEPGEAIKLVIGRTPGIGALLRKRGMASR
jgi:peptidyl-dipeptidase Dcp